MLNDFETLLKLCGPLLRGRSVAPSTLHQIRKGLGLTQDQLGVAIGLTGDPGRTVRGWESGERNGGDAQPTGASAAALRYFVAITLLGMPGLPRNDMLRILDKFHADV